MFLYILEVYVIREGKYFWDQSRRSENISQKLKKYIKNTFKDRQNNNKKIEEKKNKYKKYFSSFWILSDYKIELVVLIHTESLHASDRIKNKMK